MDQYGKDLAQCTLFVIPADMSDEEAVAEVHKRVDELGVSGRFACRLKDEKPDRKVDLAQELTDTAVSDLQKRNRKGEGDFSMKEQKQEKRDSAAR